MLVLLISSFVKRLLCGLLLRKCSMLVGLVLGSYRCLAFCVLEWCIRGASVTCRVEKMYDSSAFRGSASAQKILIKKSTKK
jgi:hypothetical protein